MVLCQANAITYTNLWIPPTLSGTVFNLSLNITNKQFLPGTKTVTYAYNTNDFWGPTLNMNKGDTVQINLTAGRMKSFRRGRCGRLRSL